MPLLPVAVQGLTLEAVGFTASPIVSSTPSQKVSVDNNGVYAGQLDYEIAGASQGECTQNPGTYSGTIDPTAQFVTVEGDLVMRETDIDTTVSIDGTEPLPGGGTTTCTITGSVKISDANQTNTEAE